MRTKEGYESGKPDRRYPPPSHREPTARWKDGGFAVESPATRAGPCGFASAHHDSPFGVWTMPPATLAPALPCALRMTSPPFQPLRNDHRANRTRLDEGTGHREQIDSPAPFGELDRAFVADPYPVYARLRAEDPVHRTPHGLWILTRYADVSLVLRDARFGREGFERYFQAARGDDGDTRSRRTVLGTGLGHFLAHHTSASK
jgi:hypothetical protein